MARTNNLTNFLTDVAGAIKEKTGDSTAIPASQFDTKIASIPTGGTYQEKNITITENGNMNLLPDSGYDALSNVRITTSVSGGDTSDATATANDLISPKTAYSQGAKITGTIPLVSSELVYDADGASTYNNSDDPIRQYDLSDYVNHVNARWFIVYGEDDEFYLVTNKESLGIYFVCYNLAKDNYDRYIMSGGNIFNTIGTGQISGNTWSYYVYKLNKSTQRFELYTTASYSTGWSAGTMILIASGGNPIYQRSGDNVDTSKMSYPVTPYVYDPTIVKLGVIADVRNSTKQAIDANAYVKTKIPYDILTSTEPNAVAANIRLGTTIFGIEGNLAPDKPDQSKTVTPTTSQQVITPDTGYELASVTVNPVTSSIDQNIVAGNIKDGVTILGVTGDYSGTDTSDADATALDIYQGKTAYVNGQKITGAVRNYQIGNGPDLFDFGYDYINNQELTLSQVAGNMRYENGLDAITIQTAAVGIGNRFAFYNDNKLKTKVRADAVRSKFGITADNIKSGVSILGVSGTLSEMTQSEYENAISIADNILGTSPLLPYIELQYIQSNR